MLKHLKKIRPDFHKPIFQTKKKQLKQVLFMGLPRNCWTSENK
jgi:hypothetical protein